MNTPSDNLGEIPKSYDPKLVEDHWWSFWEREQLFVADAKSSRPSFVIVIPPPNVTGSLHMGHMLVYTLHDIVVRWKRMSGFNTLWLPEPITQGTQNSWNDSWRRKARPGTIWAGKRSRSASGSGRSKAATPFCASCAGWAARAIGRGSALRWMKAFREPCVRCLYDSTKKA
jgi:hypothetical protein